MHAIPWHLKYSSGGSIPPPTPQKEPFKKNPDDPHLCSTRCCQAAKSCHPPKELCQSQGLPKHRVNFH